MGKKSVTTADLIAELGVSRSTLYRWIEDGILLPIDHCTLEPHPNGGTRGVWSPRAVARARKVAKLRKQGFTLKAIKKRLK
ncbi:MAG: MerR family transcriptional regulator [Myxococcales bacterium]|nr:MerR family transcriptional regulator [Myxococcales bacterium]